MLVAGAKLTRAATEVPVESLGARIVTAGQDPRGKWLFREYQSILGLSEVHKGRQRRSLWRASGWKVLGDGTSRWVLCSVLG